MKFTICLLSLCAMFVAANPLRADDFEVTVIAILASDRHKVIDEKLKPIAEEIKKKDPTLTGWKVSRQSKETLKLNQKHSFELVDKVTAEVTVLAQETKDKDKKVRINVKAPHAGEITYSTVLDKFFPVLTRYQTEPNKDRLVYAVMVKIVPAKQ